MSKSKTTKRALLSSVMAILLCVAMLTGTTFAWFTDTASTGVNKIQAGNLDVEVEYSKDGTDWAPVQDKTDLFRDVTLWEPGATSVVYLRITNKGTLALKYSFSMYISSETSGTNVNGETFKLSNYIQYSFIEGNTVYATREEARAAAGAGTTLATEYSKDSTMVAANPNPTDSFALVVFMPETVGNEANYKKGTAAPTIDLGLSLVATQLNSENDSFGPDYDTDATYLNQDAEGNYLISTANELVYFAKTVNIDGKTYAGKTVKLTADIDLTGKKWVPVGQTGATQFQGVFDGQNYTIKNMTVNNPSEATNVSSGLFGWIEDHGQGIKILNVKFDNASVTGSHYVGVVSGYVYGTIKNCEVKNSTVIGINMNDDANGDKIGGIVGYVGEDAYIDNNSVLNCYIEGNRDIGGVVGAVANGVDSFSGNTVSDTTIAYATEKTYASAGKIVSGRTGFVPDATTNNATNVTVTKLVTVSTAEELSNALNATYSSDTTIKLANDITLSGEWGAHSLDGSNNANLVIDGNGKTIYGLTSSEYYNINGFNSNGLVTAIKSGLSSVTFKNLTIDGATLTNNGGWNAVSGVFVGDINTVKVTFDTCTVTGATVTSDAYAAGFVGYVQDVNQNCPITIKNCTVTNSTFNGGDATGALVGLNNGATNITGATVTGNTINGGAGYSAAALVGSSINGTTATNVTVSGNTFEITGSNYQVNDSTYGYVYKHGQTYTVNGTELN